MKKPRKKYAGSQSRTKIMSETRNTGTRNNQEVRGIDMTKQDRWEEPVRRN